jgi:hypothetical protein
MVPLRDEIRISMEFPPLLKTVVRNRRMHMGNGNIYGYDLAYANKRLLERCGAGKGYLNETQSGSVRPPGLHIKRAEG